MKKKNIVEIIAALFILLFVYTALSKLYEPAKFRWALSNSPLISPIAGFVTYALPTLELAVAALLFFPKAKKLGIYSSFGLMSLFTIYLGYMLVFTPKLPCSCGGVLQQMTWSQHLVFNITLTLIAGICIFLQRKIEEINLSIKQEKIAYS